MMRIYFSVLGDWAVGLIDLYRAHQGILNVILVAYGVLLALAHGNVLRVESALLAVSGASDARHLRARLAEAPLSPEAEEQVRRSIRVPILASPWHFTFYRYSIENAVRVLEKKHSRGRKA